MITMSAAVAAVMKDTTVECEGEPAMLKILEAKLRGRNITVAYVKMRISCYFVRTLIVSAEERLWGNKRGVDQGNRRIKKSFGRF